MLFRHFLNDFEMVPVAPIITDVTFFFTFHMHCISVVSSAYFKIFSGFFLYQIFISWNYNIYEHTYFFSIATDYDIRFIVNDGSVSFHLMIPQYGHFMTAHSSVTCLIYPYFLAYVKV
jgi:hypothetical protein